MRFFRLSLLNIGFASFLLTTATPCPAQIKLYLKDGTYQIVKGYQVEGNRVRYYLNPA